MNGYQNITIWLYAQLTLVVAIASFTVGITLLILAYKSQIRRSLHDIWFLLCLAIGGWNLGYYITMIPGITKENALIASKLSHASGILIVPLFLQFSAVLRPEYFKNRRFILTSCYVVCVTLAALSLTPFIVTDLTSKLLMKYYPVGKIGYVFYISAFIFWVIYAHTMLIKALKESKGIVRDQIKYFLLGTIPGFMGGASCFPLIFNIKIPPYPSTLVFLYVFTTTYAILKYRLMDIRLAVTRAGIFAFVYSIVLGIPFLIVKLAKPYLVGALSDRWWLVILASGMFLASAGPFIFMKLRGRAEAALLREDRKRQEALSIVSQNILRFNRLDALLRAIVHNLIRIMQVKLAAIYLANNEKKVFVLKTAWQPPIKNPDLPKELAFDSSLIKKLLSKHNSPLNLEEIKFHSQNRSLLDTSELKQAFEALKAQLIIPAFRMGNLIGFLVLGEKRSERGYSQEDVEVLMVLANHATLAIENAIFSESEKERQAVLFHSASLASLGTMASMMGHQVNNRFQAILNLSGFKEMAEMMLAEELNPEAYRKLIQQLTTALGRISEEAVKGGEVVASLRRLSKLSTEEFKVITFKEVLDIALNLLQYKIKFNEFNFINQAPETLPPILGDSAQLGEVFLNLIDNGYDAIKERQNGDSGPEYKPQLCVKAYIKENDKYLHVEVSDNGMGIKEDFMSKIFVPFYTTKASSGKGTGLGLYVIKRIIEFHKGRISVASKYGEGTTFKLELPLAPTPSS